MEGNPRVCASCGVENGAAARFCMGCGTPLATEATPPPAPAKREVERKVITALFCDVVGSTELAEALDPEDVDRLLRTYHGLARVRIEHHGGVVEKFIGDAVVGIFGVPTAHEDDPERAIRAALDIIDEVTASDLGLHVRIGLHTGEALVRVGQDRTPEEGFATGDTLNTAARLQGVAPVDGVAVGDPTYRLTTTPFEWEDLGPAALKGKAKPMQVWRPVRARSHTGADDGTETTPFVGRDHELGVLLAAFDRARAGTTELVTVLAEPGMGKSRLVRELAHQVAHAEVGHPVTWRKGRCLPYGDGVSFWALGEIVKTHAGILETDDQTTIAERLDAVLTEPDPSLRGWMRDRLAPLVGLQTTTAGATYAESFAAWRRFLVSLADIGPAVIVVEDLHWADAAFVEFLRGFVDEETHRRILLVVTARPEVIERHPAWLERARQGTVVQLTALGDASIVALVEGTLTGAPTELVATVLERAAGSPLYAEQLAAMVRDRGLEGAELTLDETVIPPTIQALLAARIDALPGALKPAILDASVVGRIFWAGAVSSLSGQGRETTEPLLTDLAQRELTRTQIPSSMAGEAEYGFWHALLRDVAYSFLPRSARLAKHRAAAAWITAQVGGVPGDLAEIVVDHQRRALELAEATGASDELPAIQSDLAGSLLGAGTNALRIDHSRATLFVRESLELLDEEDSRRPEALVTLGRSLLSAADYPGAVANLDAARDWHLAHGDPFAAAALAVPMAYALNRIGEGDRTLALIAEARPILEARPGPDLVELDARQVLESMYMGDGAAVVAQADVVIAMAARFGLQPPARALLGRGLSRLEIGDLDGEIDVREAIERASEAGDLHLVEYMYANLGDMLIDSLRAVELVTADGRHVRATADEEPELFWGLRGAGANFGVATSLELELHPFSGTLHRGVHIHPAADVHELWAIFRDFVASAVDEIATIFTIARAESPDDFPGAVPGAPIVVISYNHSGAGEDVERDVAPLLAGPKPLQATATHESYLDVQRSSDLTLAWGSRSAILGGYLRDCPAPALDAFIGQLEDAPGDSSISITALGGAIGRVADDDAAFTGRTAPFDVSPDTAWTDPALDQANLDWVRAAMAIVEADLLPGRYINELSDAGPEITRAAYGDAKLERLRALKRTWDPTNVFRLNHNIEP